MKQKLIDGNLHPADIWPAFAKCLICKEEKQCLGFDTSNEEYGYGFLCRECINSFLDKWHKE